jgi:N6-L-threonylcarbamoyladenine synthase
MKILTLETTCDETAAAVISGRREVLSSVIASQESLHEIYHGVVPEIAARAHVQRIIPVIDSAIKKANIELRELSAVAVATTPGLAGSLLVGLMAAKSICLALEIPLIAVNHLHAHVYACQLNRTTSVFPCVGMVVSGGHSHFFEYRSALEHRFLGGTIDDAAGEAFDKVAKMLGLSYPGGPSISRVAANGNDRAFAFPRAFIHDRRLDFSFSGLKTAVRYAIAGPGNADLDKIELSQTEIADIAASFEAAIVDCLVAKAVQATKQTGIRQLCVGGGVAANRRFRAELSAACDRNDIQVHIAPTELCTDNAVMGAIAVERYIAGLFESLDLEIKPGLIREENRG